MDGAVCAFAATVVAASAVIVQVSVAVAAGIMPYRYVWSRATVIPAATDHRVTTEPGAGDPR